jgi:hypothetical protein
VPARALVDTGALLALAAPRDQYHEQAVAVLQDFLARGGRLTGTTMVLGELHVLLLQRRGPGPARAVLTALLADPAYEWVDTTRELVEEAVARWLARFPEQRFSITDAVSFEVMRREGLRQAFAFDTHFVIAGFALLAQGRARREP